MQSHTSTSPSSAESNGAQIGAIKRVDGLQEPPHANQSQAAEQPAAAAPTPGAPTPEAPSTPSVGVSTAKVPLHPSTIKLPLSVVGHALESFTGYEGFAFTDEELGYLADVWQACGVEIAPVPQALIATGTTVIGKAAGYAAWKRGGGTVSPASASRAQAWQEDVARRRAASAASAPAADTPEPVVSASDDAFGLNAQELAVWTAQQANVPADDEEDLDG